MKQVTCIVVLMLLLAVTGFGQDAQSTPTNLTETASPDETTLAINDGENAAEAVSERLGVFTAWDFVRMILVLALVIGAIYLVFFLLKRGGSPRLPENRLIRVLSTKTIANGKTIHLVEVGNQVFLVGAGDDQVSLLSEISDQETLDGIRLQAAGSAEGERKSFGEVLSSMFGKEKQPTQALPAGEVDAIGFLQQQRQRVKQL